MLVAICIIAAATSACREGGPTDAGSLLQQGVVVTPAQAQVGVGGSLQLEAKLFDEDGALVPDASFTWWTPDSEVATVDEAGMVTAKREGAVSIAAIASDQANSGFADVTVVAEGEGEGEGEGGGGGGGGGNAPPHIKVPTSHTGAGANEPPGFTPMGYVDFGQGSLALRKVDKYGRGIYDHSQSDATVQSGGNSRGTLVQDSQEGQVLEFRFPSGCSDGSSCGNNMHAATRDAYSEQYMVLRTKVAGNYWVNKAGNKFWGPRQASNGKNLFHNRQYPTNHLLWGVSAPMHVQIGFGPKLCGVDKNYQSSVPFPRDKWVTWEVYVKASSGSCSRDGVIKVWLDGVLAINATDVNTYDVNGTQPGPGDRSFKGASVVPIFGGSCSAVMAPCPSQDTWIRLAELYVSGK